MSMDLRSEATQSATLEVGQFANWKVKFVEWESSALILSINTDGTTYMYMRIYIW